MDLLSKEAYISKDWFDIEMKYIFNNSWQFLCFEEDLKNGENKIFQIGNNNFIVLKEDNEFRAFHNLCRHRGVQALRVLGENKKVINCPYHNWTYNLNGDLITIPNEKKEFPNIEKCKLHLKKASIGKLKGMIFIHPDSIVDSFNNFIQDLLPFLGEHNPSELIEYQEKKSEPIYTEIINTNWKIIVENYIDHYHLSHLHQNTLNMYDHKNAKFGWAGFHYWFFEPLSKKYLENIEENSPYVLINHISKERLGAYVPWIFPNLGLSESESTWSIFHLTPISPSKTKITVRTKIMNVSNKEHRKQYSKSYYSNFWKKYDIKSKSDNPLESNDFMKEDIYICEQQQKAMYSDYFSIGAYAEKGEFAIKKFQNNILKWIEIQKNKELLK
ncbi:aromatic ring-hydroxylating oxygenase subunit alpha [Aureivirga marina]|uniref:aromatic ring-hydroxylating oxygenase subunit alpha n=1 Tax=Aureivirga marina TaxID=1182451 RepID=UPI0018C9A247|nr:aromatic ring-hydroxylating dioxygenase subunit alpha [Aureivirga marina]